MPQYPAAYTDTYGTDQLIVGLTQLVSETLTLISGQNLLRGSVVGRITASGKVTLSLNASSDGSQVPYGILADDFNASTGDMLCGVFVKGEFNQTRVIFGTGQTLANTHDALRDAGIYLKPVVPA